MSPRDGEPRPVPRSIGARLPRFNDPIALTGLFSSVALGIGMDVSGAADGVESFLAGLMVAALFLLVDATARAERRFEFRRMMDTPDWFLGLTKRAADAAAQISERSAEAPLLAEEAERRLREVVRQLEDMGRGRLTRPEGEYDDLVWAMRNCRSTVDALTSVGASPDWWEDPVIGEYLQANREAVNRGVRIRRLFLYDEFTGDLERILREQAEAGIQVAAVQRRDLPRNAHTNFAVFDAARAWQAVMSTGSEIRENVFITGRAEAEDLARLFAHCWRAAAPREPRVP